jgi:uncharacterized LabA/DUF88 family protein
LFIDGENFLHKVREVLETKRINPAKINLNQLFAEPLKGLKIKRKIFYASKIHVHPETKKKSEELIKFQRSLRNNLVNQGFEFVSAGNVRAQKVGKATVFREKGVDVKIAVDLVSFASKNILDCAILCSSDSDLQPAVAELRERKIEVVYLGFEANPNKGLSFTTNRTILLRNPEVLAVCPK